MAHHCFLFVALMLLGSVHHVACGSAPEQIHIALAGASGMDVAWFTADLPSPAPLSLVLYGLSSDALTQSALSAAPAVCYLEDHGFHHHVVLLNLAPSTQYFYRVGDTSNTTNLSSVFSFVTPSSDSSTAFSVAIFGDMGYLGSQERPKIIVGVDGLARNWTAVPTRERLEEWHNNKLIDWVWHIGDIGYADDAFGEHPTHLMYEIAYNGFMNWIQNLTSTIPYMVLPGNHESECHSAVCLLRSKYHVLKNFTAYNARWHMPSMFSGGVASMWYSFDYGPVHFVGMNSETDFPGAPEEHKGDSGLLPAGGFAPNGTYLQWLENDLRTAAEARDSGAPGSRPWLIVAGHRPYGDIKGNGVDEMFTKYKVDMYFSGHVHSYTRSVPTAAGYRMDRASMRSQHHYHDAQGTVYIVSGGAGCDEMEFVGDTHDAAGAHAMHEHTDEIVPYGSEVTDVATTLVSVGRLEVHNATALRWVLISSVSNQILDELWITKTPSTSSRGSQSSGPSGSGLDPHNLAPENLDLML